MPAWWSDQITWSCRLASLSARRSTSGLAGTCSTFRINTSIRSITRPCSSVRSAQSCKMRNKNEDIERAQISGCEIEIERGKKNEIMIASWEWMEWKKNGCALYTHKIHIWWGRGYTWFAIRPFTFPPNNQNPQTLTAKWKMNRKSLRNIWI